MNVIRSRQHEIFTETVNKVALSADDDKPIILPDRINTHAWGHGSICTKKWNQRKYRGYILFPCDPQNIKGLNGAVVQHTVRHGKILMMRWTRKHKELGF